MADRLRSCGSNSHYAYDREIKRNQQYDLPCRETVKSIILLSGPVGAGKSTVARELIASLPDPIAYVEGDKFWFFIARARQAKDAIRTSG